MLKVPAVCTTHFTQKLLSLLSSTVTSHGTTTVERIEKVESLEFYSEGSKNILRIILYFDTKYLKLTVIVFADTRSRR